MIDVDPTTISRVVADIYEAAYDQSAWTRTVASLRDLFHGSKACVSRICPQLEANDAISSDPDPKFNQLYIDEHAGHPNPLVDAVFALPTGVVYSDHAIVGPDKLRRTRFWNDWMAPQDMYGGIGGKLLTSGSSLWFFDVQRGRGQEAFGASDFELMEHLVPHLARATDISRKLKLTQGFASAFSYLPFGVVLVDRYMQIKTANTAAEAIFGKAGSPLLCKSGHLVAIDPDITAALQNLVIQTCGLCDNGTPGLGGELLARTGPRDDCVNLSLSVGPLGKIHSDNDPFRERCAAIFIREIALSLPAGFEEQVRSLFGLTAREASLAGSLASGRSLKETAEDIHVAYDTLRKHLENIFRKTATRQQSQLVALLRSLQPPMQR